MISALGFIPRGAAKAKPTPAEPDAEELAAMRELAEAQAAGILQARAPRCARYLFPPSALTITIYI